MGHIAQWGTLLAVHTCCANQSCDPEGNACQPVGCTLCIGTHCLLCTLAVQTKVVTLRGVLANLWDALWDTLLAVHNFSHRHAFIAQVHTCHWFLLSTLVLKQEFLLLWQLWHPSLCCPGLSLLVVSFLVNPFGQGYLDMIDERLKPITTICGGTDQHSSATILVKSCCQQLALWYAGGDGFDAVARACVHSIPWHMVIAQGMPQ